jgi:hypothetical protein
MSTESSVPAYSPGYTEEPSTTGSTKDVAKDQATNVAGSASSAGQHVAGVARDEAGNVAAEAKGQAKNVLGQAHAELTQQASDQQQRVAGGLRSLGTELGSMADGSQDSGLATDLARQASSKAHEVADWLEDRDPSSLLGEVKTFARQRPGTFLALALVAGVAAGRLTRGLKDESSTSDAPATKTPTAYGSGEAAPADPYPPVDRTGYGEPVIDTPVYTGTSAAADDLAYAQPPSITDDSPVYVDPAVERTTYTDGEHR